MHIAMSSSFVFPSLLRLSNGQAKVRYCHNAVAMFCGSLVPRPHLPNDRKSGRLSFGRWGLGTRLVLWYEGKYIQAIQTIGHT